MSTRDQRLDRQLAALTAAGCIRIFADKKSGKNADRSELWACLDYLRPGDTLVVPSLDRLGRSLQDLIAIVAGLRKRGIGFRSLHEALDTTTAGGRLVFHVFAALAEFIRELIIEGTNEGLDAARARGTRLGRPPAMTSDQVLGATGASASRRAAGGERGQALADAACVAARVVRNDRPDPSRLWSAALVPRGYIEDPFTRPSWCGW